MTWCVRLAAYFKDEEEEEELGVSGRSLFPTADELFVLLFAGCVGVLWQRQRFVSIFLCP